MQSVAHLFSKQESLFMLQLSTSCFSPNDDVLVGNTSGGNGRGQTEGEYFPFTV